MYMYNNGKFKTLNWQKQDVGEGEGALLLIYFQLEFEICQQLILPEKAETT